MATDVYIAGSHFSGGNGVRVPIDCMMCGKKTFASTGLGFSSDAKIYFDRSSAICDECKSSASIEDGLYQLISDLTRTLQATPYTRKQAERFSRKVESASNFNDVEIASATIGAPFTIIVERAKREQDPLRVLKIAREIALFLFASLGAAVSVDYIHEKISKGEFLRSPPESNRNDDANNFYQDPEDSTAKYNFAIPPRKP